jgi:hypothetical protein
MTKKAIFMAGLMLLLVAGFIPAQEKSWENGDFALRWKIEGKNLIMTLTAKTTGWISVGFDPSSIMRDADIIILAVDASGKVLAEDHYGTSPTGHKKDTDIGGQENVTVISGEEKNGSTTVTFSIPLDSGDSKDKVLFAGKKVKVILASSTKDGFTSKHNKKGKVEITL